MKTFRHIVTTLSLQQNHSITMNEKFSNFNQLFTTYKIIKRGLVVGIFRAKKVMELVEQHFDKVQDAVNQFDIFLREYLTNGDTEKARELCAQINNNEHQADVLRRAIVTEFASGSMLSQTRREILSVVEMIDKIANRCQDISREILLEKPRFIKKSRDDLTTIMQITCDQVSVLSEAVTILFDDYSKLSGENSLLESINTYEHEVDKIEIELVERLFSRDIELAEKVQLRTFVQRISGISDLIENISDEIQIMVVFRQV